jgi:GDP-L-fucose synthase
VVIVGRSGISTLASALAPVRKINVGVGKDISIAELAALVQDVVGFVGEIVYDTTRPDGTPRKLLDSSRINGLGWEADVGLREGIEETYKWWIGTDDITRSSSQ